MKTLFLLIVVLQLSAIGCQVRSQRSDYANDSGQNSAPFRAIHLSSSTHPVMVSVADVSKDGNADILVVNNGRSEEHTSELQSRLHLVCRLLLEKKKQQTCP